MCLAIPGEVLSVFEEKGLHFGKVSFGGVSRNICLEYVPTAKVGEFVVVHVGFAISILDRAEAERSLKFFEDMKEAGMIDEPPPESSA